MLLFYHIILKVTIFYSEVIRGQISTSPIRNFDGGCRDLTPYYNIYLIVYPIYSKNGGFILCANVAELVDALDLGSSGVTCESSSLSIRMNSG